MTKVGHTIAIIGRPNVGKSTLFNALVGKRLAITHHDAGVTRDIKEVQTEYEGIPVCFLDTGGITDDGIFSDKISQGSYAAIEESAVVMLVVSVEEMTAEDEDLIAFVRKLNKPHLFVINKVDNEKREWAEGEYYRYGLGEPIMVSALHRSNVDFLWERIMQLLGIDMDTMRAEARDLAQDKAYDFDETEDAEIQAGIFLAPKKQDTIKLLIMGKPNTGKSSLLNAFLGKERAMVSEISGTTRDIVEEETEVFGQKLKLIDSAGIRKKNRIYDDIEYYANHRAISSIEESDVVILLIDVMDGMSEQDKKLASLIMRKGKGIIVGLNKWDLIKVKENRLVAEKDRLSYLVPQMKYVPIFPLSAKNKKGLKEIIASVQMVYNQLFIKINTSLLNRDLQKWMEKNPPAYMHRRRGKMKFIAQCSVNPIKFQVRVNNPQFFDESYKQYIINNIRKQYNINNIPIQLDLLTND